MGNWDKVNKLLDRELAIRERVILKRISALVSGRKVAAKANGNGHSKPVEAKRGPTARQTLAKVWKDGTKVGKARQLHGRYLGLTRSLTKEQKAQVKKTRAEKGVRAAIAEAKRLRASA